MRFLRSYVCNKLRRMSRRVSFDSRRRHQIRNFLELQKFATFLLFQELAHLHFCRKPSISA